MTDKLLSRFSKVSRRQAPKGRAGRWLGALAMLVAIAALAGWASKAEAYPRYNNGCQFCHGAFTDSTSPKVPASVFPFDSKHEMHRNAGAMDTSCNLCHSSGDGFNPFIGSSDGTTSTPGHGCIGCHGRDEDPTAGVNITGAGLRQHHWATGTAICSSCHPDSNPLNFTTVGEDVQPPYYGSPDTLANNACNTAGVADQDENWTIGDLEGLDNDGDNLYDSADSDCAAAEPDIALNPTSLDFGAIFIGDTSTLTSQIENAGVADLTVTGIAPGAGTSAEYSFTAPATPFVVPPGGSQTVSVTYGPVDLGVDNGSLEVTSDDPDEPTVSLALTGTGEAAPVPDINLSPAALDFGPVTVGSDATIPSAIENLGTADLTVTAIDLCAGTTTEFSFVADPTPFVVPPGGSRALTVTYTPADVGPDTGCIEVASDDPDEPLVELALDGVGAAVLFCDIDVAPLTLDFGTVLEGSINTLITTIGNTGTADCTVDALTLSGSGDFFLEAPGPVPPFTVTPGGTVDVPVLYMPPTPGPDSGTLSIASDDPDEAVVEVALTGVAEATPTPDINLNPALLDFGVVTVGGASTLDSQVENLGTADLVVSLVDLCAGTSAEFGFAPLASTTIPPGSAQTLSVTYTPTDAGTDTGCIAITSNDPDEGTVNLDLAGTGEVLVPDINLDPAALDFGVVTIGDMATLSAVIENLGTAELTVGSILPSAGTSAEFGFTAPAAPFTIPVGGSQSVTVTYAPADVGLDTGSLEIASDDPDKPLVALDLSGTGQEPTVLEPDINLEPAALDFGTVLIGGASTLSAQIQNLGTGDLLVTMVNSCVGTSSEFGFTDPTPVTILPGGTQPLSVTYTPTDVGTDTGCLEVLSDDPDESLIELGLTGTGMEPGGVEEVEVVVPGAINPENRGVTPIKLLADMDLDIAFVACGPAEAEPRRLNMDDANGDGFMDVVGLFETRALGLECGDTTLMCEGELTDGRSFEGVSGPFKTVGQACKPAKAMRRVKKK